MNCECNNRNRIRVFSGLAAAVVLLCAIVSFFTAHLILNSSKWSKHDAENGHKWLHRELNLTETEVELIDALEPAYRHRRAELQRDFNQQILSLRELIVNSQELTSEVRHAIHELHVIHGQLQELSISHYYEMMDALPEDKQRRLKEIAVQALSIPE